MNFENLRIYENKKIIKISDLEERIRNGEDIDLYDILIELPNGKVLTFDDYIDGEYNVKYSNSDPGKSHSKSPLLKNKKSVPKGVGSKKFKKRYCENIKMFESDSDYSKFIGQTPIVNNVDNDEVWIYKKIFYYKKKKILGGFYLCSFNDLAYNEWYIERKNKKIYYDIKLRNDFLGWLTNNKYYNYLGKTKTDVENKIDDFYISLETDKYNL